MAAQGLMGAMVLGCVPPVEVLGAGSTSQVHADTTAAPTTSPATTVADVPGDGCPTGPGCRNLVDLLFVIDNSLTMGEEQLNLARNFAGLIDQLQTLEDGTGTRSRPT